MSSRLRIHFAVDTGWGNAYASIDVLPDEGQDVDDNTIAKSICKAAGWTHVWEERVGDEQ